MESRLEVKLIKFPSRFNISKIATDRLRKLKQQTKLNNNVLSRIALMIAINDSSSLINSGVGDVNGQEFSRDLLFGENIDIYEIIVRQFMIDNDVQLSVSETIAALIEVGVHKIGHVKSLEQLCQFTNLST